MSNLSRRVILKMSEKQYQKTTVLSCKTFSIVFFKIQRFGVFLYSPSAKNGRNRIFNGIRDILVSKYTWIFEDINSFEQLSSWLQLSIAFISYKNTGLSRCVCIYWHMCLAKKPAFLLKLARKIKVMVVIFTRRLKWVIVHTIFQYMQHKSPA